MSYIWAFIWCHNKKHLTKSAVGNTFYFLLLYIVEYRSTIAVGVVLKRSCQSLWSWRHPPFNQPKKGLEQNGLFYTRNFHLNPRAVALEIAHWKLESLPLLSIIIIYFAPMFLNWRVENCLLTYYIQMENVFLWQNISVWRCVPNEKPLVCGSQLRQSQFVCCYAQQSVTCLKADKKVQIRTFFFQASYQVKVIASYQSKWFLAAKLRLTPSFT